MEYRQVQCAVIQGESLLHSPNHSFNWFEIGPYLAIQVVANTTNIMQIVTCLITFLTIDVPWKASKIEQLKWCWQFWHWILF